MKLIIIAILVTIASWANSSYAYDFKISNFEEDYTLQLKAEPNKYIVDSCDNFNFSGKVIEVYKGNKDYNFGTTVVLTDTNRLIIINTVCNFYEKR